MAAEGAADPTTPPAEGAADPTTPPAEAPAKPESRPSAVTAESILESPPRALQVREWLGLTLPTFTLSQANNGFPYLTQDFVEANYSNVLLQVPVREFLVRSAESMRLPKRFLLGFRDAGADGISVYGGKQLTIQTKDGRKPASAAIVAEKCAGNGCVAVTCPSEEIPASTAKPSGKQVSRALAANSEAFNELEAALSGAAAPALLAAVQGGGSVEVRGKLALAAAELDGAAQS